MSFWHVYMVKCSDGSYYTGITTDRQRRIRQHNGEIPGGAAYTRSRRPVVLVYTIGCTDRSHALKREHALKKISHEEKKRWDSTMYR